ncbi:hypothetical protein WS65_29520 [Burkholderia anthina]|nr:hypothetical protein WS65_29520 [Burkholderia anthina]
MDRGDWDRPFRCPTWLLVAGSICGYANLVYAGAGADLQGEGTLRNGLIAMLLIVPVFLYRHYWQDRGRFPAQMQRDMELAVPTRSMWLNLAPYAALIGAVLAVAGSHYFAWGR